METRASTSATEMLANFSERLRFEDLPHDVVHELKRLLLDTVACGLGGLGLDKGSMALDLAVASGGKPEATVYGTAVKLPAAMAAFVNGELMNALDWCALQPPAHTTPYVIPPAMALAEVHRSSGKELIAALAVANELACRVADSLGNMRSNPGAMPLRSFGEGCTQFGATAGAARILGLDAQKMRHALGLAGYHAPVASHAKYQQTVHVGLAKYGPAGWTAQAGVVTAQLAAMGYRGDDTVLDGDYGFWAMNGSPACDWNKLTSKLGEHWSFLAISYKHWPCCGSHMSTLDAFTKIIDDNDLAPHEIVKVLVESEAMMDLARYVNVDIRDHVDAASSLNYNVAVAAHRVPWGPQWQSRETLARADVRAFMHRVEHGVYDRCEQMRHQDLVVDGRTNLKHRPARVTVHARGRTYVHATDFARWIPNDDAQCRASDDDLARKFRANAQGVLTPQATEAAIDQILNLERLSDASALASTLAARHP
jgi:2-methylcitrate dehydratase PrpD